MGEALKSQRSSNRLDPSDGCCRSKEHRKKVRLIRPRQSEAEKGDQRNYGQFPYAGVRSVLSPLPSAQAKAVDDGVSCVPYSCGDNPSFVVIVVDENGD